MDVVIIVVTMASLRLHPKSAFYYACFRDSNGKRTTRSTKTRERRVALKIAIEWEAAARKANAGRLVESQVRAVINDILEHAGSDRVQFYKVNQWLNEWLAGKTKSNGEATAKKYKPVIDGFLKSIGPKANESLGAVTILDIRSFRDNLSEEGRSATTVNQLVSKVLGAAFSRAQTLGLIQMNPAAAVEPLKAKHSEAGVFSVEQITALLEAAPSKDWKGLILAGYFTGQRLGDLANLTWGQIDREKNVFFLDEQAKTGTGVAIPLHATLLAHIDSGNHQKKGKTTPVFSSIYGKSGGGKSGLSETFKRIIAKAGIPNEKRIEAKGKMGRGRNKLSFHSLRHSFNSALANAGVPADIRQKLTGHRDADSHRIYTHFDLPALKQAVDSLPDLAGSTSGKKQP